MGTDFTTFPAIVTEKAFIARYRVENCDILRVKKVLGLFFLVSRGILPIEFFPTL